MSGQSHLLGLFESLTGSELLVIIVLALVVLGPEKLPGIARQAGRWFNKIRDVTSSLQEEMRDVLDDPAMQPIRELGEFAAQPRRKLAEYAQAAADEDAARGADTGTVTGPEAPDDTTGDVVPPSDASAVPTAGGVPIVLPRSDGDDAADSDDDDDTDTATAGDPPDGEDLDSTGFKETVTHDAQAEAIPPTD